MKKQFYFLAVLLLGFILSSCDKREELIPVTTQLSENQIFAKVSQNLSSSSEETPTQSVDNQILLSQRNLEKYMGKDLVLLSNTYLGSIENAEQVEMVISSITENDITIASGNILEKESIVVSKIGSLSDKNMVAEIKNNLTEAAINEIKAGQSVLELNWQYKGSNFKSLCVYNENGIVWDNLFVGLIMMEMDGETAESDAANRVASKWYKQWWTAGWLWGSKRGEIGYKITIFYTGSTVSSTDRSDWGSITLGKAKSESRITKNSGSYGKIQYALGLCTPVGSLSFSQSGFTVSFSGLGSNIVRNGTKSLYP